VSEVSAQFLDIGSWVTSYRIAVQREEARAVEGDETLDAVTVASLGVRLQHVLLLGDELDDLAVVVMRRRNLRAVTRDVLQLVPRRCDGNGRAERSPQVTHLFGKKTKATFAPYSHMKGDLIAPQVHARQQPVDPAEPCAVGAAGYRPVAEAGPEDAERGEAVRGLLEDPPAGRSVSPVRAGRVAALYRHDKQQVPLPG
jgi:hypothetical protein